MSLLRIQRREWAPSQRVFEIPPDPFNGAQLRAVGGKNTKRTLAGRVRR